MQRIFNVTALQVQMTKAHFCLYLELSSDKRAIFELFKPFPAFKRQSICLDNICYNRAILCVNAVKCDK